MAVSIWFAYNLLSAQSTAERFWFCVSYLEIHMKSLLKTFPRLALGSGCFSVHKELSYSYREGIDEKMKSMYQPYKTKVLKKVGRTRC